MKKLLAAFGLVFMISCNSGETSTGVSDSLDTPEVLDTMPVVQPPILDSSSIIKTPPTNDENVILPDTNQRVQ